MNPTPSFIQRFIADTPPFFKKVHMLGLFLVGLAVTLADIPSVPSKIAMAVGAVGGTLAVISQFACKDLSAAAASGNVADVNIPQSLTDGLAMIKEVHAIVTNPPPPAVLAVTVADPPPTANLTPKPAADTDKPADQPQ